MFMTFLLSFLARRTGYAWTPALDFEDGQLYSTLLPGAQY